MITRKDVEEKIELLDREIKLYEETIASKSPRAKITIQRLTTILERDKQEKEFWEKILSLFDAGYTEEQVNRYLNKIKREKIEKIKEIVRNYWKEKFKEERREKYKHGRK